MDELEQVILIARFADAAVLGRALDALSPPQRPLAIFANGSDEASALTDERELEHDWPRDGLDAGIAERLDWHLENEPGPLLAVEVPAEAGRALRHRLLELGGDMIDAPQPSSQANDAVFDPGMDTDEPELPPNEDRIFGPN